MKTVYFEIKNINNHSKRTLLMRRIIYLML